MMKKIVFTTYIFLIQSVCSHGQWYVKKYNVTDIDFLSREQLEGSLKTTKTDLLYSDAIAGIVYLGRVGRIKSVINEYYSYAGSLKISPAIIVNSHNQSFEPGFTLTYDFGIFPII